jgi:alanyl-tRNA synthetase
VLRRLLRRAVRHGQLIGIEAPFLVNYATVLIDLMGEAYPELRENQSLVRRIILAEEERFSQTLRLGQNYLEAHLQNLTPASPVLSGKAAFELHDRYGFPIDLTVEIAAEQGVEVDREAFELHMEDQRTRARAAVKDDAWGSIGGAFSEILNTSGATRFEGYIDRALKAKVVALVVEGPKDPSIEGEGQAYHQVDSITDSQKAQVILVKTPFYGEMGGQVGDTGLLRSMNAVFTVEDTKIHEGAVFAHSGHVDGSLAVGDSVHAQVDTLRRERIERNHTATHLLHHALREILGEHVKQAGSLVAPDRLRFDFTHFEALSQKQLSEVEELVNTLIMEDSTVNAFETTLEEARKNGVTALFGEKYGETVRVLEAGPKSRELCGGTHVKHTAQIGFLKIVSESSVGASLRRIEAVTSFDALRHVNRIQSEMRDVAALLKAQPQELGDKIEALQKRVLELEGELKAQRQSSAAEGIGELASQAVDIGYLLVIARIDGQTVDDYRRTWDLLRAQRSGGVAVVFGGLTPAGTPLLLAAATSKAVELGFDANAVIKQIGPLIKGGGGGKPIMAQAGGKDAGGIDKALGLAKEILGYPTT